ncbi:MAG: hypothetical protein QCI82_03685 [Candidatus Thermoplasmatota archaeon]|nr:hypothetical protein [Candidatus Thermoplasmatota archaeon]
MGSFTRTFGGSARVRILEVFSENPEDHLSAPQIMEMTGISRRNVYLILEALLSEGILVKGRRVGKCDHYLLNPNDVRSRNLGYLESLLTIGHIEKEIRADEGIPLNEPLSIILHLDEGSISALSRQKKPEESYEDLIKRLLGSTLLIQASALDMP